MGGKSASVEAIFSPAPGAIEGSQLTAFMTFCATEIGRSFPDQAAFHDFSVSDSRTFWELLLAWSGLPCEGSADPVRSDERCEHATFFPNLRLSYAECLLDGGDDRPALAAYDAGGLRTRLTRGELRARVSSAAAQLATLGVEPGDRVAAIAGNDAEAVVAGLACAAVGATFSSAAPDMGTPALLSRFEQLAPKLLLGADGDRVAEVARSLPSLAAVVTLGDDRLGGDGAAGEHAPWPRFPFNHPLFVMFTSGTTGRPKCIVHGAGGTLLEHVKEHRLHVDLRPDDRLFFHTTTAWMMWNWQLSALASGAEIVLYDGPIGGPETLWRVVADMRVTVFGTSPPYLKLCEDSGWSPARELDLPDLRAVLSTGSILHDRQYDWVAENVGRLPLQSISGGTDIIGCFVLGSPNRPVHRGMIQCRSLGMDVQSEGGELVCRNPFPSRPLGLLGDDDDGARFHGAYFAQNPGMWTHGDLIEFDMAGQARMLGRSDGVVNVQGVRIGPAEIYRALGGLPELVEAMAVEREERLVLLVVLRPGIVLDGRLVVRIRREIARNASALHVPELIVQVGEVPVTHSGKRSERAARDALAGVSAVNRASLANPDSLEAIRAAVEAAVSVPRAGGGAARDGSTESRLLAIWEAVLGVVPLHRDDDFFDIGGTSLAAVRLLEAIHEEMGVDLPLSALLDAPTAAQLAEAIERPQAAGAQPLVLLRPGGERPLFLVHSLFGDVLSMRPLALRLDTARAVYGIQARGLNPGEEPHRRVEQMAGTYIERIRSVQPAGPYVLGGHSLGGLVAFEIARLLLARGEEIEWLGLVDTDLQDGCLGAPERMRLQLAKAVRALRAASRDPRTRIPRYARKVALKVAPRAPIEAPRRESRMPPLMRRLEDAGWEAFGAFCPQPYPGRISFFQARVRREDMGDPLPVWRRVAGGGVEVEYLDAGHADVVTEPNVRALAARMSAHLAAAGAAYCCCSARSASGHRSRHS